MTRLIKGAATGLWLLFVTAIAMIRAQPYDNHYIRAILLPLDCSAPCFLGIRPGMTTASDAIALLRNSQWVESETIAYTESDYGGGAV